MEHRITGHRDSDPTMKCAHCGSRKIWIHFDQVSVALTLLTFRWEVHGSNLGYEGRSLPWFSSVSPKNAGMESSVYRNTYSIHKRDFTHLLFRNFLGTADRNLGNLSAEPRSRRKSMYFVVKRSMFRFSGRRRNVLRESIRGITQSTRQILWQQATATPTFLTLPILH